MPPLTEALSLINDALLLRPGTGQLLSLGDSALRLAFSVLVAAGLSEAVGESVTLFINRVTPRRFAISLLVSAVLFAFTYLFFALSVFLLARYAFGSELGFSYVAALVAFGQAPRLFSLLAFIPYLGLPISVLLWTWSIVATVVIVAEGLQLAPLPAVATIALGSLLLITAQRTIGRPLLALARLARQRAAGVPLVTGIRSLRQLVDVAPEAGLSEPRHQRSGRGRSMSRRP